MNDIAAWTYFAVGGALVSGFVAPAVDRVYRGYEPELFRGFSFPHAVLGAVAVPALMYMAKKAEGGRARYPMGDLSGASLPAGSPWGQIRY